MSSFASVERAARKAVWPALAEAEWSRGMIRDLPRSSIPVGGLYDGIDCMVDRPGLLYKRGGSAYQGSTTGATTTGVGFVSAPEYPTGLKVVALGADGHLYDITSGNTDAGALGITCLDNPKLYVDRLVVPAADGTSSPKKVYISGGNVTIAALGGSPPAGKLCAVHLGRVVLGASSASSNRIYWSPVPDPEGATWDASAYTDFNHSLTALAPCQGVLLGFSGGAVERIVGDTPPGTTGENMALQPVGQHGCADARSIVPWGGNVIFASQDGVWVTNGLDFDSLTEREDGSGILSYWRSQYATVAANSGIIAAGLLKGNYLILTLSYSSTLVDTLLCYLPRKAWTRLTNVSCRSFAQAFTGSDELYGGTISGAPGNRVLALSGLLSPAAGNKADANGTAVTLQAQMRMMGQGIGLKAYGHGHVSYDMTDAASDNPTLAISIATGIEADSGFAAVQEGSTLAETTVSTRKRFIVNKDSQAVNLKFVQTNASAKTELYAVELESRAYGPQADGQ